MSGFEYLITFEFEAQVTTRATIPLFEQETKRMTFEQAKTMLEDPSSRDLVIRRIRNQEVALDEDIELKILESAIKAIELKKAKITEIEKINIEAAEMGELTFESVEQMIEQTESYGHFEETIARCRIPSDQLETYIDSFKAYAKKLEADIGDLRELCRMTPEEEEKIRKQQKVQKMMNDAVGGKK